MKNRLMMPILMPITSNLNLIQTMKKVILVVASAAALLFAACGGSPEVEALKAQNDSLQKIATTRDSSINSFLQSFNDIEQTLQTIKEKEKLLSLPQTEVDENQKERINQDILSLYELLKKNQSRLSKLKRKLKKSDIKIAELNKMIKTLQAQVKAQGEEIEQYKTKLATMHILVDSLFRSVDSLYAINEEKDAVIESKISEINTAFYVIGTRKELIEKGVLADKMMGKELNEEMNQEYFTKIDISKIQSLPIFSKKAEIISNHPKSSYKLAGEKTVDSLIISDGKKFWSVSKYLVIVVNK